MKYFPVFLLVSFLLLSGLAKAGDEQQINERIKLGGDVYLEAGVYELDGPVIIASNMKLTGSPDAILRVSSSSSQWFTGMTGIISSYGYVDNVEISGFQIDGNCDELPSSYANSAPQYDHDAERAIIINGETGRFCNNIVVKNMNIYDCFSDGIHIRFANSVFVEDNIISNCQHEGLFATSIIGIETARNKIAGITSDCLRYDNCINFKVYDNVLFSYTGNNNNGAYKGGENGLQIGDAGSSHGYDASNKPTSTQNGEVYGNTFANNGLNAIILGSAGRDPDNNVYIHDNKFIGKAELETMGIHVGGIDFNHMPTKEKSKSIFESILGQELTETGYVNQSSINYETNWTKNGKYTDAWIFVPGYKGQIRIGNDSYIPGNPDECAIVYTGARNLAEFPTGQKSTKTLSTGPNNSLVVKLNVETQYKIPEKKKSQIFGIAFNKTVYKEKSESVTYTKSYPAPKLFPALKIPKAYITYYNNSHAIVTVPDVPGIIRQDVHFRDSYAREYRLIGLVGTAENGFRSTEFEKVHSWGFTGDQMSQHPDGLYIKAPFDVKKLEINITTPYGTYPVTDIEYTLVEDNSKKIFDISLLFFIIAVCIFGRPILRVLYLMVGKWL